MLFGSPLGKIRRRPKRWALLGAQWKGAPFASKAFETYEEFHERELAEQARRGAWRCFYAAVCAEEEAESSSGMSGFEDDKPAPGASNYGHCHCHSFSFIFNHSCSFIFVGGVVSEEEDELNFQEEDVKGEVQWLRAIGFGSHDEVPSSLWLHDVSGGGLRSPLAPANHRRATDESMKCIQNH